ncbi:MAG: CoA-transferase [Dehalococcoidia bacterium]
MEQPYTPEEMMAAVISRRVRDRVASATGANSPIPAGGCLLAKATHAPNARIIILGSEEYYPFATGKEFHDFVMRGNLDLFFLSGIQIDADANINLHVVGDYEQPRARFPGAFGSGAIYFMAKRVILFRTEHTRRTFVPHVDFITAPGHSEPSVHRPGGPVTVVTPMAVLIYNREAGRLELESVHPGHTIDEVLANTGFLLPVREDVHETVPPTVEELELLRGPVRETLRRIYPAFVARAEAAAI